MPSEELGQAEQDVLGGDEVVLHPFGIALGGLEDIGGGLGKADLDVRALHGRAGGQFASEFVPQSLRAARDPGDDGRHNALFFGQQRQQEMRGLNGLVVIVLCYLLRLENRFLRFLCIVIEFHMASS